MRAAQIIWMGAVFALTAAVSAAAQVALPATVEASDPVQTPSPVSASTEAAAAATTPALPSSDLTVPELLSFKESDVKFRLEDLMDVLRDRRHEGWVLAAYPDPKTSGPLIGAGFTLDLPHREHAQTDPLNLHPFIEPSSAELWQVAGLDMERLHGILDQYERNMALWKAKKYRKKIATLEPQITDDEAEQLLRVSALQAIYNAKAYFRNFDRYTASQQMALSQLVYQMGVNLQEFSQFLNLINSDAGEPAQADGLATPEQKYWKAVQASLIQSQWARLYRVRAVAVIAMLDPEYADTPNTAEHRVSATLRPAVLRRWRGRAASALHGAAYRTVSKGRSRSAGGVASKPGRTRKAHARRK